MRGVYSLSISGGDKLIGPESSLRGLAPCRLSALVSRPERLPIENKMVL